MASFAVNDWSTPCFSGKCSYDIAPSNASAAASLQIWSDAQHAISDVTEAAGWVLLGCGTGNGTATEQDVRMVCMSDAQESCAHLTQGGAEGTLVRLPEGCGMPFARVAAYTTSDDQSVPGWAMQKVGANNSADAKPVVRAVKLDTDFAAINSSSPIYFGLKGTSAPAEGQNLDLMDFSDVDTQTRSARRSRLISSRYIPRGVGDDVKNAVGNAVSDLNDFNKTLAIPISPIVVNKPFTLVNLNTNCAFGNIKFKASVNGKIQAQPSFGVVVAGTIAPPNVTDFALTAGLTADVNAVLSVTASANGKSVNIGPLSLFTLGLPGLDIPGIFAVGPQFILKASANANLGLDADADISISYHIANASAVFPPDAAHPSVAKVSVGDSPLKLSASPDVSATGSVSAHLTPTLELGISAFGSNNVGVFVDLDAQADLDLNLDGSAQASSAVKAARAQATEDVVTETETVHRTVTKVVKATETVTVTGQEQEQSQTADKTTTTTTTTAHRTITVTETEWHTTTDYSDDATVTATADDSASTDDSGDTDDSEDSSTATSTAAPLATGSIQGCISATLGLSADIGADADFFKIFSQNTQTTLFSKTFTLFNKCFGSSSSLGSRSSPPKTPKRSPALRRAAGLVCPAASAKPVAPAQAVVDQTIKAAAIKPVSSTKATGKKGR